jgi:hypothetical protein
MSKTIEKISNKSKDYLVKKNNNGFYVEVRTRNKLRLLKEYFDDWIGNTYKHPVFLSAFYCSSIESIKRLIDVQIRLDNERHYKKQY